ncbi:MAG: flagellar basal body P-ring protein FlgI [Desulfobacterales bacterium]|nr:flagellar basal body P-ring protein FlgI [Desulfobacterales bacterium]
MTVNRQRTDTLEKDRPNSFLYLMAALLLVVLFAGSASAARIKDIANIIGVRSNQLVGYGLVIGLNGTGDKDDKITVRSISEMLEKMGLTVKPDDIKADNVASVIVTAKLPAFARAGSRIDVLVSSIGGADNLQGGTLLFTPLKGADRNIYAIAQGPVSTGGFKVGGKSGGGVQKNHPTVGRVAGGATIEREVKSDFANKSALVLSLHNPDFTTASRTVAAINKTLAADYAKTPDSGTIEIAIPPEYDGNIVGLVTVVENIGVNPDMYARVVINERTGTVVMGADVRLSTIAIAHGSLSIQIRESASVSQPGAFSQGGQTVASPESDITVNEKRVPIYVLESGVSIGDVVRALNALGVTPHDLIAIFQAIKAAGALQAELEVI